MKNKTFYITTPIYYPTAKPHLGTAYTTVVADILARYHKLLGEDVFFSTGTDEHGEKLGEAARKAGIEPKDYVDKLVEDFKSVWTSLNIKFDGFIRTTDKSHEETVKLLIKNIYEKGDLYEGDYEGLYCISCEAYLTEKDLVSGKCPSCGREVKPFKEKAYFFRLSKYQKKLLELYKDKSFILPASKRNEIINRVNEGLNDVSFTRSKFKWGIEFPINKNYIMWVWPDALTNYISVLNWPNGEKFKKFWPANVHLIGKDILWFHAVIWPAMLISAGIKVPKTIFAHGWWTVNGEKMSKSKGNVIDPLELIRKYGVDSFRYFIIRNISFGEDGDFSEHALKDRHNNELANKLGNLVSRVAGMAGGKIPKSSVDLELASKLKLTSVFNHMNNLAPDRALAEIFEFIDKCNEYAQEKQPWKLEGKEKDKVLYSLADSIRIISILIYPFMPATSERINEQFNFPKPLIENAKFDLTKQGKINKSGILFEKI
jgi:methionyl-tRNA synthetase